MVTTFMAKGNVDRMKKKVMIITGGEKPIFSEIAGIVNEVDVIICADSGGDYAYEHHIMPHYLLGDFDSISAEAKEFFLTRKQVQLLTVPMEKDFTDSQMAMELAKELQAEKVYVCGGWGSRLDHSITNIFLFASFLWEIPEILLLTKGCKGYYSTGHLEILGERGQTVSLIPLKENITNVSLQGFYYPLLQGTLKWGSSMGNSNVLIAEKGAISHDPGLLFVVQYTDKDVL